MLAHLKAAGYADDAAAVFSLPEHPKEGGLTAILKGSSKTAKPLLLLGHLDVVEAKREDWVRDPFTMVEENGYFYGRGTSYMKAMDAKTTQAALVATIADPGVKVTMVPPDPSVGDGTHGLNERRSVRAVYVGRDFLTDLVKVYADAS